MEFSLLYKFYKSPIVKRNHFYPCRLQGKTKNPQIVEDKLLTISNQHFWIEKSHRRNTRIGFLDD